MALRRIVGLALLGLGLWLGWASLQAILAYTDRGGDLMGYLFEPPTGIFRVSATLCLSFGGLLVLLNARLGGTFALLGAVLYGLLGGLMAVAGADMGLWLDEVLYALAAAGLCALILGLKRL